jgi:diphthamide biosynthesis protein 2
LSAKLTKPPLVFVLGDTTFGSCCPDEVSAMHLDADVLIHYGHACLSPTFSLPVLYSFGITDLDACFLVDTVIHEVKRSGSQRLLLLFQVQYHHVIQDIQTRLSEKGDILVIAGHIPSQNMVFNDDMEPGIDTEPKADTMKVGGLELPCNLDLSKFTCLYVGDPTESRQYANIMMRFASLAERGPNSIWTYQPSTQTLETELPGDIQRRLNRRFFLTQKARDAATFGILVGTLSQRHFRNAVTALQRIIHDSGRSCYTFAVGKINDAKLANFGEIECYVLVACSENSILENERDLHVPVITPLELDIALGNSEWAEYSLDYNDFLSKTQDHAAPSNKQDRDKEAPYFSLVSGKFEDSRKGIASTEVNLSALPGAGQLSAYTSKGAEFLRNREYQGLETLVGETEVRPAGEGENGIASNYSDR